ncbi:putative nucleotidyltransferase MAB21L1 [Lamellibrachia satsuma]|nr:putative nucleotidyltransferase MAB21L1 [Lamellibrachia satsuma]
MAEISLAASREHKCYVGQRRCESPLATVVSSRAVPAECMPTYIAAHDALESLSAPAACPPDNAGPTTMMAAQSKLLFHLNKYYNERVRIRKGAIAKTIRDVCKVVQDVLKEVEVQEPRFISSLTEMNNHFDGLQVISPTEFEVVLYLNQMGVFNFVDDGSIPGCAVLKLSDGRKRSMSLWVEFITASGYLSARKIRSRFQTLVAQAVDKCSHRDSVRMMADTTEVRLRIRERYVVQITPAFKCASIWPRSAAHWPVPHVPWPNPNNVAEVKTEGFDLLSKESIYMKEKQSAAEGDAWVISFLAAETMLLQRGCRRKCLSILRTLRDRHLDLPGKPIENYHLKTLLLYECEKHPREMDWDETCLGDRINGIILQLISCLQNRRCPHYFLPNLDLFKGKTVSALDSAAKQAWRILRELLTNGRSLEKL